MLLSHAESRFPSSSSSSIVRARSMEASARGMVELALLDIGIGPLSTVLAHVDVKGIASAAQVCKMLYEAAQAEAVWQHKASELYPAETLCLEGYGLWKTLVRDGNCKHASLVLPLAGRRCLYKYNRVDYHFECRLLVLQWLRAEGKFRLYFDARGENDLRHPSQSSLGFCVYRDPRALQQGWERWHRRLEEALAGAQSDAERAAARQELAQHEAQREAIIGAAGHRDPLFDDLLSVARPVKTELIVRQQGHYMGYLEFESLDRADSILEELPDSYASKREAQQHGLQLEFCYANPLPVMPHAAMVDYHTAPLLTLLPGETLEGVLLRDGRYAANSQPMEQLLAASSEQAQRASWAHVGQGLLTRAGPPWLVMAPPFGDEGPES